jgi:hypothetical protein
MPVVDDGATMIKHMVVVNCKWRRKFTEVHSRSSTKNHRNADDRMKSEEMVRKEGEGRGNW